MAQRQHRIIRVERIRLRIRLILSRSLSRRATSPNVNPMQMDHRPRYPTLSRQIPFLLPSRQRTIRGKGSSSNPSTLLP